MKRTLLIVNANSGSAQAIGGEELAQKLKLGGFDVVECIMLPDGQLPDRGKLESAGIETVAVLSGDGTISGVCAKLAGWQGEILVLPGGTMNLLSRRLHGELTLPDLLDGLSLQHIEASEISVVRLGEREVLTGVTVGPSTKWAEVREGMRQGDMAELAEKVPEAWSETLADDGVRIEGSGHQNYASIFVEPEDCGNLSVTAFRANNLGDMVGHGVAWLRRDFREGPRDDLGMMHEVTISGAESKTGMLIDGEVEDGALPLICTAGMSSLRFLQLVK